MRTRARAAGPCAARRDEDHDRQESRHYSLYGVKQGVFADWGQAQNPRTEGKPSGAWAGRRAAGRLTGTLLGVKSIPSLPLSAEGQAHRLIGEATDKENLGAMYIWCVRRPALSLTPLMPDPGPATCRARTRRSQAGRHVSLGRACAQELQGSGAVFSWWISAAVLARGERTWWACALWWGKPLFTRSSSLPGCHPHAHGKAQALLDDQALLASTGRS